MADINEASMDLEVERKKLEYRRIELGIHENEFRIKEREADIARIRSSIDTSKAALAKIEKELNDQGVVLK